MQKNEFELISITKTEANGIGNRFGETIIKKYRCPCGNGTITTEVETMVGHKDHDTTLDCTVCSEKYYIKNAKSRDWSLELKN